MNPKVLMVDDRPENLIALEAVLEDLEEVDLAKAASGAEALQAMEDEEFAAVLLDVQMPEMDGFEVARRMRAGENTRFTPILFLTALDAEDRYVFEGYEAGAVDYITKPYNPEVLRSKLRVFIDLYQQRRHIEEMSEKLEQSNRDLERFAYMISHDLQEPIRVVGNFTQIIADKYGDQLDDEGREFMGYVVDGAERMKRMIRGLLDFSRVNSREIAFQPVSLEDCLDDALADLQFSVEESGAVVERSELPEVLGDRPLLTQLLQNLVGNAIKYRSEAPPRIRIDARVEDANVLLSIEDNGIGMEPDQTGQAFIMFKRLVRADSVEGTGIGLAICKRIVERHRGWISVESAPGKGSTFTFALPNAP